MINYLGFKEYTSLRVFISIIVFVCYNESKCWALLQHLLIMNRETKASEDSFAQSPIANEGKNGI